MEPVRLGVIGCGVISGSHLDLAAKCPLASVVAVADLIPERAQARAAQFGIATVYGNDDDLLKDPRVEAVVLAMPAGARTPVAYKALKLGKHVLIEKPVASRAADVEAMIALRGRCVAACCSSRYTFTIHAEAAARCVASGALGTLRLARFRAVHPAAANPSDSPPPWRQSMVLNGGGILVNWSCYDLNYLMHVADWQLRPRTALAAWWPVAAPMRAYAAPESDADSHFVALLRCEGGQVLSMERAEFSSATPERAWELIGSEGTLHLPMLPPQGKPHVLTLDRFVPGQGVVSETVWEAAAPQPPVDNVITDFVRAIRENRPPRTTLERALVLQRITDAVYDSAAAGASVPIR